MSYLLSLLLTVSIIGTEAEVREGTEPLPQQLKQVREFQADSSKISYPCAFSVRYKGKTHRFVSGEQVRKLERSAIRTGRVVSVQPLNVTAKTAPRLISCMAKSVSVPGGVEKAQRIASCETGGTYEPTSYNPTGCDGYGCGGMYQHMLSAWDGRAASYGHQNCPWFDGYCNIHVTFLMVKDIGSWDLWQCQ